MNRSRAGLALLLLTMAVAIGAGWYLATRETGPSGEDHRTVESPTRAGAGARAPSAPAAAVPAGAEANSLEVNMAAGGFAVRVRSSGQPVSGAEVRLYRRSAVPGLSRWEEAGQGLTGPDGTLFLAASIGPHLLSARAPGTARTLQEVVRPRGEERTAVTLELGAGLALSGRTVERRGGAAIPFATITASPVRRGPGFRRLDVPSQERASATSDAHGRFRIEGLPAGRLEVEARAVGHSPARSHDLPVPRSAELLLELSPAGVVEGMVTRDGRPVPGATVSVIGAGEPVVVETGAGGGFAADVEPGLHRAFARLGVETGSAGRAIPVAAGSTAGGVEIPLGPAPSLSGRIRSGARPVPGASVVAVLQGDAAGAMPTTSGAEGAYEMRGLLPGTWSVTVTFRGHADAVVPAVNLRPGDRFVLDVSLSAPAVIEGTVKDIDGAPVSAALVTGDAQRFPGGGGGGGNPGGPGPAPTTVAARTDAEGHYRLEGVAPGPVRVAARRDAGSPASVKLVTVEEGETATADLAIVEGGIISGTVVDPAGNPVPGARIWTSGSGGPMRPGEARQVDADAAGTFLLALPAGSWALNAMRLRTMLRFTGRPTPLATVRLAVGQRAEVKLVLPDEPPATLSGRVLEPGGAPAAGAVVWIGAPGAGLQLAQADAGGAFSIAPGTPDPLQVSARNGGRTGSVQATPPSAEVVVELQPAASVQGRLVGEPAPETFAVTASRRSFVPGGGTPEQQFGGGTFTLDDVAPGQVSLHVKTSDGRVGDAQVTVGAAETRAVDVPLSPSCTLTGKLVDAATRKPVTRARILIDGVASRRYAVVATGQFTRITSEGDHQVSITAAGYAPLTLPVKATAGAPVDLGEVELTALAPPGPAR